MIGMYMKRAVVSPISFEKCVTWLLLARTILTFERFYQHNSDVFQCWMLVFRCIASEYVVRGNVPLLDKKRDWYIFTILPFNRVWRWLGQHNNSLWGTYLSSQWVTTNTKNTFCIAQSVLKASVSTARTYFITNDYHVSGDKSLFYSTSNIAIFQYLSY